MPPIEPLKSTIRLFFAGVTVFIIGAEPTLYVLTEADAVEFEDVHAVPETALSITE